MDTWWNFGHELKKKKSYSRRRDRNNCVRNFNYVRNVVRPHKTWVCRHICQLHGAMDTCNMPHARQAHSQEFESCPSPNQPLSLSQRHLQVVSMCNCSAWCMVARRVSKPNICRLCILHCLCQHGCEPEIFMFPRLSCVCIHLEILAEVKVHPYHACVHVCVGSCMCFAQATPLSKLQWV